MTGPLARLTALCVGLPEVTQRVSHGEPCWFVRDKKLFVMYAERHHDDRVAFWAAAAPEVQESLVAADPDHFFRPPYVGHRGWVGAYLDTGPDWVRLEHLVEDAYRQVAPKTLSRLLDGP